MVVSVTLNPCVDHALFVGKLIVGDTNRVLKVEKDAGGKGANLSRIYAELGGKTIATGFLGGTAGIAIRGVLQNQNVDEEFVEIGGETRTNYSIEDDSGNPPTTLNSKGPTITKKEWNELQVKCRELAKGAKWIAMGGSIPPGLGADAYKVLSEECADLGARILIDADGEAMLESLKVKPHFVKPNSAEAGRLLGREIHTDDEAITAVKELYEMIGGGDRYAVISRGKNGAVVACQEGVLMGKSPKVEAKSSIGSGDSMLGGMLWALDSGKSVTEALQWGLAAGAATATTDGSEIGRKSVIELLFDHAKVTQITSS